MTNKALIFVVAKAIYASKTVQHFFVSIPTVLWLIFFLLSWFYAKELLFFTSFPLCPPAYTLALSWSVWLGRLVLFWLRWRPSRFHSCFFSLKWSIAPKYQTLHFIFIQKFISRIFFFVLSVIQKIGGILQLPVHSFFIILHNDLIPRKSKNTFYCLSYHWRMIFFPTYLNTELSLL